MIRFNLLNEFPFHPKKKTWQIWWREQPLIADYYSRVALTQISPSAGFQWSNFSLSLSPKIFHVITYFKLGYWTSIHLPLHHFSFPKKVEKSRELDIFGYFET